MEIFNFIGEKSNDMLSKMSEKDKHELLELLKNYRISLRDRLALDPNVTFGLEFEFKTENPELIKGKLNYATYKWICNRMANKRPYDYIGNRKWDFKEEKSIITSDTLYGREIATPILVDSPDTWKEVQDVCNIISYNGGTIGEQTAGHVHIGTQVIGNNPETWLNFFKLYTLYEGLIYRFTFGEYESYRPKINVYAHPLAHVYYKKLKELGDSKPSIKSIIDTMTPPHKSAALSLRGITSSNTSYEENKTIEFRMPNASLDPVIWQNNVNFFINLLSSANKGLDTDLYNSRIASKTQKLGRSERYVELNVDEALELADLIFDTNLDKINFLRQYIKEFETNDEFRKSASFTK